MIINEVIEKTEKIHNVANSIVKFFKHSAYNTTRDTLLGNMCNFISNTLDEALSVMGSKGCRIERLIGGLPSLRIFDEFAVKACGYYCQPSCSRGFPSQVLIHWKFCLQKTSVGNVNASSGHDEERPEETGYENDGEGTVFVMVSTNSNAFTPN